MKVEFRFNGTANCILIPENSKDKQLIQLCFEGQRYAVIQGSVDNVNIIPQNEEDKQING